METSLQLSSDKSTIQAIITIPEATLLKRNAQFVSMLLAHEITHAEDKKVLVEKFKTQNPEASLARIIQLADQEWSRNNSLYEARGYAAQYHAYILQAGLTGYNGLGEDRRIEDDAGAFIRYGLKNPNDPQWVNFVNTSILKPTVG